MGIFDRDGDDVEGVEEDEVFEDAALEDEEDDAETPIQDQGSLDEPVKSSEPEDEVAQDLGTPELRREAARRLAGGVNKPRERFPWEVPPPGR